MGEKQKCEEKSDEKKTEQENVVNKRQASERAKDDGRGGIRGGKAVLSDMIKRLFV